ncbi:MAG: methyltransferase domain-containing protein [Pirellulales bacterium]
MTPSTRALDPTRRCVGEDEFDTHASHYEESLQQGLRLSGEGPEYFAQRRILWTRKLLQQQGEVIRQVLDFGCGVGLATSMLRNEIQPEFVWGYDPSLKTIERAQRENSYAMTKFCSSANDLPIGDIDLVYCNGVFHHIELSDRPTALDIIYRSLRPGGWFALWENNPWNLGTRYIMSHVPFDRDAIVLSPPSAKRMLRSAGFQVIRTDAWFLFPHCMCWLRPLERLVNRLPLGGQYLVLVQKPSTSLSEQFVS